MRFLLFLSGFLSILGVLNAQNSGLRSHLSALNMRVEERNYETFLIDRNAGTSYQMAMSINELNAQTQALCLYDMGLSQIPQKIYQFPQLKVIILAQNNFSSLPYQFFNIFKNLTLLDVSGNSLDALPYQIGQLSNLKQLIITNNQIAKLPYQIGQLSALKEIWCDDNQLSDLPYQIGQLANLKKLTFRNNQLSSLPYQLKNISGLRIIELSGNNFTQAEKERLLKSLSGVGLRF